LGVGGRVQAGDFVTRIVVIGTGAADVAAQLDALGLSAVRTAADFRELAESMPVTMELPALRLPPAPAFGSDRPQLEKAERKIVMRYYVGAGFALAIALAWLYHLDATCEAAGGVLMRGAFKPVCVCHLELVK
jgi:hypothetical protein